MSRALYPSACNIYNILMAGAAEAAGSSSGRCWMRFGVTGANVGPLLRPGGAEVVGQAVEEAGLDSLWTYEHVVVPATYSSTYPYTHAGTPPGSQVPDMADPLIWLAWVGAHTSRLRLGTGVLILPVRNPVLLAKELATLSVLTAGRLALGIGTGWLEEEFDALGVPFSRRGARTDEYVQVMRALWGERPASFHGEFTSFEDCHIPVPPPPQVPIYVGGHSDTAARRAGRLGDGYYPAIDVAGGKRDVTDSLDRLEHLIVLARRTAAECGREPADLDVTVHWGGVPDEASAERLVEMGVNELVSFLPTLSPEELPETVKRLRGELEHAFEAHRR